MAADCRTTLMLQLFLHLQVAVDSYQLHILPALNVNPHIIYMLFYTQNGQI